MVARERTRSGLIMSRFTITHGAIRDGIGVAEGDDGETRYRFLWVDKFRGRYGEWKRQGQARTAAALAVKFLSVVCSVSKSSGPTSGNLAR